MVRGTRLFLSRRISAPSFFHSGNRLFRSLSFSLLLSFISPTAFGRKRRIDVSWLIRSTINNRYRSLEREVPFYRSLLPRRLNTKRSRSPSFVPSVILHRTVPTIIPRTHRLEITSIHVREASLLRSNRSEMGQFVRDI